MTQHRRRPRNNQISVEAVAGNGLLDRRALLGRGLASCWRETTGATASLAAAAEPLAEPPWSLEPGAAIVPYEVPSRFEKSVARTLSNPNFRPGAQGARTPHHLLNGTITPNGLHFVVSWGGAPDIDPDKHRLLIHGLVKRPLIFTLDALGRYPMVSRITFLECGGNSAPLFSPEPIQDNVQALHGLVSCAEWTGVKLSTSARGDWYRPDSQVVHRRGCRRASLEPQRAAQEGLGRCHDRALPERRAAHAGQRLSDAPAVTRLRRQHERQVPAADQARRRAGDELLRIQDLCAAPAEWQSISVLFSAGGEVLHHPALARNDIEGARALRDFWYRLFRHRAGSPRS